MASLGKRVLLLFLIIGFFSQCGSYIKIPVVTSMPADFLNVLQGGKKIGIAATVKPDMAFESTSGDIAAVLKGSTENALQGFGYFTMVDIASRQDRMKELVRSQQGLTQFALEAGKEFAINGLIYLNVPQNPIYECKTRRFIKEVQDCPKKGKCSTIKVPYISKILFTTVFIQAKLVNTETGRSLSYSYQKPFEIENSAPSNQGVDCPARSQGFDAAARRASFTVAKHLSPEVRMVDIVVGSEPIGVAGPHQKSVEALLKQGIKWVEISPPNFEEAKKTWLEALRISDYSAAFAYWNLAVAFWAEGNLVQSEDNFRKSMSKGGPEFMSGKKMQIYSMFLKEKKRIEIEKQKDTISFGGPPMRMLAPIHGNQMLLIYRY